MRLFFFSALGWRLGLQVVTGAISVTFILGTFYRSASLYHPQRRAILHIKNQKRKIKDKNKIEDKIPFFDFSTLKSKTVRILLISTGISAFGINTPLFYLAYQAEVNFFSRKFALIIICVLCCCLGGRIGRFNNVPSDVLRFGVDCRLCSF